MSSKSDEIVTMYPPCADPYDLWASPGGVAIRKWYYQGDFSGKAGATALGLMDWLFPQFGRGLVGARKLEYPIVVAHWILQIINRRLSGEENLSYALTALRRIAAVPGVDGEWSWGIGFHWMSKNGLYGPEIPFVTHTPYVMEALLAMAKQPVLHREAMELFHGTWQFLESLRVMHEKEDLLALSYAPVDEPRIVVNANSYAAFAYAMHAVHGAVEIQTRARERAKRLVRWVVRQQHADGSWLYYADGESGNFIDCFHSCFVVKNLLKVKKLLPELACEVDVATTRGARFIQDQFFDSRSGLCRRFVARAQRDPFRWDLYDQAEFLGLLVDFGDLQRAREFAERVERRFRKGDDWYCRIDILGRRWGRNFLRWGITPFWYHCARLDYALNFEQESRSE